MFVSLSSSNKSEIILGSHFLVHAASSEKTNAHRHVMHTQVRLNESKELKREQFYIWQIINRSYTEVAN